MSGDQAENCWDKPLHPEPTGRILGKLAEASKGWEFLPKFTLPDLWCLIERGRYNCISFPFQIHIGRQKTFVRIKSLNCDINFLPGTHWWPILSLPGCCLLVCLISCPENLTWQPSSYGPPRILARQKYGMHLTVATYCSQQFSKNVNWVLAAITGENFSSNVN